MNDERLMHFMFKDEVICDVWYNFSKNTMHFKNYSDNWIFLPFGSRSDDLVLTIDDLDAALEDYTFPETRQNCKEILRDMGLDFYDRFAIVRVTHGAMINRLLWIKFDDDPKELCWEDMRKQLYGDWRPPHLEGTQGGSENH